MFAVVIRGIGIFLLFVGLSLCFYAYLFLVSFSETLRWLVIGILACITGGFFMSFKKPNSIARIGVVGQKSDAPSDE